MGCLPDGRTPTNARPWAAFVAYGRHSQTVGGRTVTTPTTTPLTEADYKQAVSDLRLVFWIALSLHRGNALLHSDAVGLLLAATRLQNLPATMIPLVFGNAI